MTEPKRPRGRPPQIISAPEAAREKNVDVSTVTRAIADGKLPAYRMGKRWIIKKADLDRWEPDRKRGRPRKARSDEGA